MKFLLIIGLIALSGLVHAAGTQSTLTLDRPSIVVVFTPEAEVPAATRNSEGFDDFLSDFQFYSADLASTLHGRTDIAFIRSSATTFIFKPADHRPITRKDLSGFGFIIYVPGKPPVTFAGVATGTDVLCALKHLAPEMSVPAQC